LRLLALGFRTGKKIELIRKASFSGPLQVRVGTTDVMLRRLEAAKIRVLKS
jgi:ferrous iron transport protein A